MEEIESYSDYLRSRGLTKNSIDSYTYAASQLLDRVGCIDDQSLLNHKDWLISSFSAKTANARIASINSYLDFIDYEGLRLRRVKVQQKPFLDNVISNEEYRIIADGLANDESWYWHYVVRFLACTGARISEFRQFEVKHVLVGYMDLLSKGYKLRRVYIPADLCKDGLAWCESIGRSSGILFSGKNGCAMSARGISLGLKRVAKRYGVNPDVVYPHSFRHLFAKNFIARNPDIAFLADLMGHESIETTRIYLRKTSAEQRKAFEEAVDW